jgi:ABC-type glycerol-3-phosphate transport system substrate-binding protein
MNKPLLLPAIILAAATVLAGCGGGGDRPTPPQADNEVPSSATASPAAYSNYAGSVPPSESSEPLKVDKVVPPTTESGDPIDVT